MNNAKRTKILSNGTQSSSKNFNFALGSACNPNELRLNILPVFAPLIFAPRLGSKFVELPKVSGISGIFCEYGNCKQIVAAEFPIKIVDWSVNIL